MIDRSLAAEGAYAEVQVDYWQYDVWGGVEIIDTGDAPGLEGVALCDGQAHLTVLAGRQSGSVMVRTEVATASPPLDADPWDLVAEIDLVSEGTIMVSDWAGPPHPELMDLASVGDGRYRLRLHVASFGRDDERHLLIGWPVDAAEPPRILAGAAPSRDAPSAESAGAAAAVAAVEALARFVGTDPSPRLCGDRSDFERMAVVDLAVAVVHDRVAAPWTWVGSGGSPDGFLAIISADRDLFARGSILRDDPDHVRFTWVWERLTGPGRPAGTVDPSMTVDVKLTAGDKGTAVRVAVTNVAVEWAEATEAIWSWATERLGEDPDAPNLPPWEI